eukprot:SAG31_NODE_1922_length_6916_cov_3.724219_2_plen_107_part_00
MIVAVGKSASLTIALTQNSCWLPAAAVALIQHSFYVCFCFYFRSLAFSHTRRQSPPHGLGGGAVEVRIRLNALRERQKDPDIRFAPKRPGDPICGTRRPTPRSMTA